MRFNRFNAGRFLLSLALIGVLVTGTVTPANAVVLSKDLISTQSVQERELSITQAPDVMAKAGILIDDEGKVLWSRNADQKRAMASITKVMTAVVALENLDPDQVVTVSSKAATVGESSANLKTGEKIKVSELIKGLMVLSGNDAAVALAEATVDTIDVESHEASATGDYSIAADDGVTGTSSPDPVTQFVALMNAKADELGLNDTHFENPHGLDAKNHHTTANDLGLLVRYAMENETFHDVVSHYKVKIKHSWGTVTAESTNLLLKDYKGADGVKTGYTKPAGYCLAGGAHRNGVQLYAISLGSTSDYMRVSDCKNLLDWGFKHYVPTTLVEERQIAANVSVSDLVDSTVPAVATSTVKVPVLDYDGAIDVKVTTTHLTTPVKAGDVVGSVKWTQGDDILATTKLVAGESVEEPSFFGRVGITLSRAWRSIVGKDTSAKTVVDLAAPVVLDPTYVPGDSE